MLISKHIPQVVPFFVLVQHACPLHRFLKAAAVLDALGALGVLLVDALGEESMQPFHPLPPASTVDLEHRLRR
jgi:hypothetical protein